MRVFRRGRKDMAWAAQSNRENLRSHFDAEAGGYLRRWQRFPWSALRDRETAAIRRLLGRLDGLDVLDLGCGAGFHTRLLLDLGARHVTSVVISVAMLEELPGENVTPLQADAETVAFDTPFPVIVSAGLLEFVPDPVAVLINARRATAPGGRQCRGSALPAVPQAQRARRQGVRPDGDWRCRAGGGLVGGAARKGRHYGDRGRVDPSSRSRTGSGPWQ